MDRSFLSQAEVIAASRKFTCVRLATYEDRPEAEFLASVFVGRSGELENTVFSILSPDGKRALVRSSRGPQAAFADAAAMAAGMNRIAAEYKAAKEAPSSLPTVANVRLALDVAACDDRPLVIVCAAADARKALEQKLTALAWSDEFIGQFIYVAAASTKELGMIEGAEAKDGVIVVKPDTYGLKGKVLQQVAAGDRLADGLRSGLSRYERREKKAFPEHIRDGRKEGVFWETVVPVTDPMELRAREQGRGKKE